METLSDTARARNARSRTNRRFARPHISEEEITPEYDRGADQDSIPSAFAVMPSVDHAK
jgi:hypothetical protein